MGCFYGVVVFWVIATTTNIKIVSVLSERVVI